MKRVICVLVACVGIFSSCLKDRSSSPESGLVIVDKYLMTQSFTVPAAAQGKLNQVVYHRADGDTEILATTASTPLTIQIPSWLDAPVLVRPGAASTRVAAATASDYLEIIELARENTWSADSWVKDGNYVLMFEDSREGDFDYNDLVLYVRHSISGNGVSSPAKITLSIKPIAMGGVNKIALGWEDKGGEHMLTDDVRRDFFFDKEGFINTCNGTKLPYNPDRYDAIPVLDDGSENYVWSINGLGCTVCQDRRTMMNYAAKESYPIVGGYFKFDPVATTCSSSSNDTKQIKWFIKTSGSKYYVASIDRAAPEGTFPYGLCIPNAAYHTSETVNIWEAYPGFTSWVQTGSPLNWSNNRVKANCYEKHVNYARW